MFSNTFALAKPIPMTWDYAEGNPLQRSSQEILRALALKRYWKSPLKLQAYHRAMRIRQTVCQKEFLQAIKVGFH